MLPPLVVTSLFTEATGPVDFPARLLEQSSACERDVARALAIVSYTTYHAMERIPLVSRVDDLLAGRRGNLIFEDRLILLIFGLLIVRLCFLGAANCGSREHYLDDDPTGPRIDWIIPARPRPISIAIGVAAWPVFAARPAARCTGL